MQIQDNSLGRHYSNNEVITLKYTDTRSYYMQDSPFCVIFSEPHNCFERWRSQDGRVALFSTRLQNGLPTIDVIAYRGVLLPFDQMRLNQPSDVTCTVSLGV